MSEETLRRFLERVNSDAGFREQLQRDPGTALQAFELSGVEQVSVVAGDEDALRRLAGMDVAGYLAPGGPIGGPAAGSGGSTQFLCTPLCTVILCTEYAPFCPDSVVDVGCSRHVAAAQ